MRIHIYNPEHDYALASGSPYYTPPVEVRAMRDAQALLPLMWADAGDAIIVPDNIEYQEVPSSPGIELVRWSRLREYLSSQRQVEFSPWGWDSMVRLKLLSNGADESLLPSEEWIRSLRALSHRRTSISFNARLNRYLDEAGLCRHISELPVEFHDTEEALRWLDSTGEAFFKAPWSSAGRGVQSSVGLDREIHIRPWLHGMIRRQGSVIGETIFPKHIDFATEWYVDQSSANGPKVSFLGLSVFETSTRGKYHGNRKMTRNRARRYINSISPDFNEKFIEAQRKAITDILEEQPESTRYNGYIGIDMMASRDGQIRGGVELNFRRTMGIPPADVMIIGCGNVGSHLKRAFSGAGIRCGIVSSRSEIFPPAEVYVIAVKDESIAEVARKLIPIDGSIVCHTSGSIPVEVIRDALPAGTRHGVFYPLQTFSKNVEMPYDEIPFLIEGDSPDVTDELMRLAGHVSRNVREAGSAERAEYHLAAVLSCNFTNHLCTLADRYLSSRGLDFRMLLPLMCQTVSKLRHTSPADAQTGPAARGDLNVIKSHLSKLEDFPEIRAIYSLLSDSILDSRQP